MKPKIWMFILILLAFLMVNAIETFGHFFTLLSVNQWVIHTQKTLIAIEDLRSSVADAAKIRAGYPLSDGKRPADGLKLVLSRIPGQEEALRQLTADNPFQQRRLNSLDPYLKEENSILLSVISIPQRGNTGGLAFKNTDIENQIRDLLSEMRQEENRLLALRAEEAGRSVLRTIWSFCATLLAALASLAAAYFFLIRNERNRQRLQKTESRLFMVIQNVPLILCSIDPKGVITLSTGKGLEAVGLNPHGNEGKSIFDAYRNNPNLLEKVQKALDGQESRGTIEVNGFTMEVIYKPVKDPQGKVTEVVGVATDVSAWRKAEEALKTSEANYREIFDKANDGIIITDPAATENPIVDMNASLEKMTGFTLEEYKKLPLEKLFSTKPGFTAADYAPFAQKALTEGPQLFEWQALHKDGHTYWIEVSLQKTVLAGKIRLIAFLRDIGDRKRLDDLTRSQDFINTVLENLPNMVFVKDAKDLKFVMFNKAGEALLGIPREDLIGKNDYDFFPKNEADFFTSKDQKTIKDGKLQDIHEETIQTRHQGPRILHTKKIPVLDASGVPRFLLGISEDITEQKKQENLRVYAKALEASNKDLQDFIFVASHDLQEPLRKIQAFGNFLNEEEGKSLSETGKDYLKRIRDASLRMSTLLSDLLDLTRITTRAKPFTPVALSEIVQEVLSDLEIRLGETGGKVEAAALPTLDADPAQMRQLFQNLIGNALKFQKPGETPSIRISAETSEAEGVCRIQVKDNGIGFDDKYAEKIFNIFQRLHGQGQYPGTGIGLAICRKVVERHGGKIEAKSQEGAGALFIVTLPLRQAVLSSKQSES